MSRQLRLEFPGAIYHVTHRGNEKRVIYRDNDDRHRFLDLLARVVADRRWILHAYVLMDNHYHLLVEITEVGLSRGVKWLNKEYAQKFNWRHSRVGHLFQGRFRGILVEREGHLLELVRYIVLNPVRCGAVVYAGDYEWSNYRATAGLAASPPWLEVEWTLAQFGMPDRPSAHEAYRRFVADGRGASYNPWEALVGQIYLGSSEFRERMQALVKEKERSHEHPRNQRKFVRPPFETIATVVAKAFSITMDVFKEKSRDHARKALVHVGVEDGGLVLRELAEFMNVSASAVSKLLSESRRLQETDRAYRSRIEQIRKALS
jgi:putative transposase